MKYLENFEDLRLDEHFPKMQCQKFDTVLLWLLLLPGISIKV
jgi:hypothetical protein